MPQTTPAWQSEQMARQKPVFKRVSSPHRRSVPYTTILSIVFVLVLLLPPSRVLAQSPSIFRYALLVINAATFLVYRHDKLAAVSRSRRVRETTLHVWALAGGWPAAIVAQRVLGHKTRSWGFLAVFWTVVVLEEGVCLKALGVI